jgi:hypothetical protein
VSSSITGGTGLIGSGSKKQGSTTLHQDVVILASNTTKPPIPIVIHSPMAHLTLQTGCSHEEKDCTALKCIFDSRAALSTANFCVMEAVIRKFPHILKKIYLPSNYVAVFLSGIINTPDLAPFTTELSVGLDIHLPYSTKDGNDTSLLVAAGPDIAVNLVLGLPFIKAMGMVDNFVSNVCKAKNLLCEPLPIDFKRATKSNLVFQSKPEDSLFLGKYVSSALHILGMLKSVYKQNKDSRLPHLIWPNPGDGANSRKRPAETSGDKLSDRLVSIHERWIPPATQANDNIDYEHQVLGDLGYLLVSFPINLDQVTSMNFFESARQGSFVLAAITQNNNRSILRKIHRDCQLSS